MRLITFNGITQNVTEWASTLGIHKTALYARFRSGMSVEDALSLPPHGIFKIRAAQDRTCKQCHTTKPATEFYGLNRVCKPCYITKVTQHRETLPDTLVRGWKSTWNKAHPEHMAQNTARYRKANPDAAQTHVVRRRSRIAGATINDFTTAQWRLMQILYNHCCAYCGKRAKGHLTREHIIPVRDQGNNTWDNIVPACKSCNSHKHTGPPPRLDFTRFPKPVDNTTAGQLAFF